MGSKRGYEVSLHGTALNSFKVDFNNLLTKTIRTMQEKGVEDAAITAKIDINLSRAEGPNLYSPDSEEEREYTVPKFKHKVTASMQMKEEASGKTGGKKFELIYDSSAGVFLMAPLQEDKSQTSLWDRDAGEEDRETEKSGTEEPAVTADEAVEAAAAIVREENSASAAMLQRRMGIGYQLAAALLDKLEELGIVGPFNGEEPRTVLPHEPDNGGGEE